MSLWGLVRYSLEASFDLGKYLTYVNYYGPWNMKSMHYLALNSRLVWPTLVGQGLLTFVILIVAGLSPRGIWYSSSFIKFTRGLIGVSPPSLVCGSCSWGLQSPFFGESTVIYIQGWLGVVVLEQNFVCVPHMGASPPKVSLWLVSLRARQTYLIDQ